MQLADRLQTMPISMFAMVRGMAGLTLAWEKAGETCAFSLLPVRTLLTLIRLVKTAGAAFMPPKTDAARPLLNWNAKS